MNIQDYPFLYETHLHTNTASACAHNSGSQMAAAAKEYGYTGIVVHAHPFREEDYIPEVRLFPDLVDAVEGINACVKIEIP